MCEDCIEGLPKAVRKGGNEILHSAQSKSKADALQIEGSEAIYPYPDAVYEGPWNLKSGGLETDIKKRIMTVPVGGDDRSRLGRLHELGHLVITPTIMKKQEELAKATAKQLEAVADLQLGMCLEKMGYDLSEGIIPPQLIAQNSDAIFRLPEDQLAELAVSIWPEKKPREVLLNVLRRRDPAGKLVERVKKHVNMVQDLLGEPRLDCDCHDCNERERLGKERIPHIGIDMMLEAASYLYSIVKDRPKLPGDGGGEGKGRGGDEESKGSGVRPDKPSKTLPGCTHNVSASKPDTSARGQIMSSAAGYQEFKPRPEGFFGFFHEKEKGWGKMYMTKSSMERQIKPRGKLIPMKMGQEIGAFPERAFLWPVSRKIFVRRAGNPLDVGVSILIDCSGSMGMTSGMVQNFIDLAPGAIVAGYGGGTPMDSGEGGHCATGELRIYCRNGRAVKKENIVKAGAGGNVVDGPALRWLAAQPAPRLWISDGCITGKNESAPTPEMAKEVTDLCKRYRILRFNTIGAATAAMKLARAKAGEIEGAK